MTVPGQMMGPVAFVTGSTAKYAVAASHLAPFGIQLEHIDLDLTEIQSPSVQAVAEYKAAQVFAILGRPLLMGRFWVRQPPRNHRHTATRRRGAPSLVDASGPSPGYRAEFTRCQP